MEMGRKLSTKDDDVGVVRPQEDDDVDFGDEGGFSDDGLGGGFDDGFDDLGFGDVGGGDGMNAMQKHSELLKELMNFAPYLKEKYNGWLGVVWDQNSNTYVRNPLLKPIMNVQCAAWCVTFMNTYARDNNMITYISPVEYAEIYEDLIDTVMFNIGTRSEEFEIKEYGDIMRVCDEIIHTSLFVMMGSGEGRASKILSESVHRNENVNYNGNPQQQQGVMMSGNGGGKKNKGIFSKIGGMFNNQ